MAKPGRKKGSGSRYTTALSERICAQIADGKPLKVICREIGIPWRTVYDWFRAHPDFEKRMATARLIGEEAIAAECLEIADTPLEGVETTEEATTVLNQAEGEGQPPTLPAVVTKTKRGDMLGHRKLQIETRLKLLAKWNPKKWGDKLEQTHKGDPGAPVQLVLQGSDVHG